MTYLPGVTPRQRLSTGQALPAGERMFQLKPTLKTCSLALLLAVVVIVSSAGQMLASPASGEPLLSAGAAILLEQSTGQVLFSKATEQRMYPASLTKLLTALVVLEYGGDLDQTVPVGQELWLVKPNSSRAGLEVGDRVSLRNLIYAMLLPSGNDAAYVAAVHTARKYRGDPGLSPRDAVSSFAALMNQEAKALGATRSQFVNPDGYHDARHYSTAADLALIAREVMRDEFLRQVVAQETFRLEYVNRGRTVTSSLTNTNRLIDPNDSLYYAQATGLKTGTTTQAGHCLAASASGNNLSLIAIILDSSQFGRWQDARRLLDYGLNQHQLLQLCKAEEQQLTAKLAAKLPGFYADATLVSDRSATTVVARADAPRILSDFVWEPSIVTVNDERIVIRPQAANGTAVGKQVFSLDGQQLAEVPLVLRAAEPAYRPSAATVLLLLTLAGMTVAFLLPIFRRRI